MSLRLYYHPLSSYCHKALIALYENDTPFTPHLVNLMDPADRAAFLAVWPVGKFPVLKDEGRDGYLVPESSIVIEYLDQHYPGKTKLIPADPDLARQTRFRDRFFDFYMNDPVGKIVTDKFRPEGKNDTIGVEQAKDRLRTSLDMVDKAMAGKTWAMGDIFTMADCAAAPSLFYTNMLMPFAETHRNVAAYHARLQARPSVARVVAEAQPYLAMMPK